MLKTLTSFLKRQKSRKAKIVAQTSGYVYRDELDKKPPSHGNKVKKQVTFDLKPQEKQRERQKHILHGGDTMIREKSDDRGLKFKVLMTKEEAERLLSRCRDGGVLPLMDVANELIDIPLNRITMISSSCPSFSSDYISDGKLETIHEDD